MSEHPETVDQPEPEQALSEGSDPERADADERPVTLDDPSGPAAPVDDEDRDPALRETREP
jgi:hypothetical protein